MNDSMLAEYLTIAIGLPLFVIWAIVDRYRKGPRLMHMKPNVITLCGSTRFPQAFEKANRDLTLKGNIVISVGLFGHNEPEALSPDVKRKLDELHFRKIDISDAIYVLNMGGYIGESTRNEIAYAQQTGKSVIYHEKPADIPIPTR
jgi:hypothetical protein